MRILFAEDDRDLSRAVKALLEHAGYSVDVVYNGNDALEYAEGGNYDGMILDWMMPGQSGVQVLEKLRRQLVATPCLMLTARDAVEDRVTGLDAGADDYLAKPFATSELLARVRALLRRKADYAPDVLRFSDIELDRGSMALRCGDREARLNNKSFQLMEMLAEHPSVVHSVDQIMERVWGWDSEAEINVVWVNISSLRKKLNELECVSKCQGMQFRGDLPAFQGAFPQAYWLQVKEKQHRNAGKSAENALLAFWKHTLGAHVEIKATRGVGYSLEQGK